MAGQGPEKLHEYNFDNLYSRLPTLTEYIQYGQAAALIKHSLQVLGRDQEMGETARRVQKELIHDPPGITTAVVASNYSPFGLTAFSLRPSYRDGIFEKVQPWILFNPKNIVPYVQDPAVCQANLVGTLSLLEELWNGTYGDRFEATMERALQRQIRWMDEHGVRDYPDIIDPGKINDEVKRRFLLQRILTPEMLVLDVSFADWQSVYDSGVQKDFKDLVRQFHGINLPEEIDSAAAQIKEDKDIFLAMRAVLLPDLYEKLNSKRDGEPILNLPTDERAEAVARMMWFKYLGDII